jgi:hypothetical protein
VLTLVTDDSAGAVRTIQRALGFPTRATAPDLSGAVVAPVKPTSTKPERVKVDGTKLEQAKRERAKREWPITAGPATPRRKPDGRPARGFGRRKAESRRSRQG